MRDFFGVRRQIRHERRNARDVAREVEAEIEAHLALRVEHLLSRGIAPEVARAEALRRFGDIEHARRALIASARKRDERVHLRDWLDSVRQDVIFATRQMRRSPAFASLAVLTFALGIGLTTAVFATIDGVLLRPLPFEQPDRLVALESVDSVRRPIQVVSADDWYDWKRENRTLASVGLYMGTRVPVLADGAALRASTAVVSPEFFEVMRPRMRFGRPFFENEVAAGEPVAVVGEGFWRSVLGERRGSALTLRIGAREHTIVGVVADGQDFPAGTDVWVPYRHVQMGGRTRNNVNWLAVGRLAANVTVERATADLSDVSRRIRERDPVALYAYGVHITPLREELVGSASTYLRLLMASVGLVLLIACANLASANLARGAARSREMVVRAALGAGRGRIVRQLLVEHLLLALIGGAAGALLAVALTRGIVLFSADQLPRARDIVVDGRVLAFGFFVSAAAGVLSGILPALQASRASARGVMVHDARGAVHGGRGMPGRVLVGAEIALALVLVSGAGLLIESFRAVLERPLGFETRGVATAEIALSGPRYGEDSARRLVYWNELLALLRAMPGVEAVGLANWIPFGTGGSSFVDIGGKEIPGAGAGYRVVSDGYFDALRIPLRSGRLISATDDTTSPGVAVVNEAMARKYWPGENPVGRLVRATSMEPRPDGSPPPWLTIVGVVGNVRHWGYEGEPEPEMYVALRQLPLRTFALTLVVRGRGSDSGLVDLVRRGVHAADPGVPADIELLATSAARGTAERRFTTSVLSLFGALALALAAIGVYGALAFAVARRTREMAVRAALGADRADLLRLVLGSGARVIAVGTGAGLVAAWFLTRLLRSMLFEVEPGDPKVLALATATIAVVALLAALVPARAATRVEPMHVLKSE